MRHDYKNEKHPALVFILRGLIPLTEEGLLLAFKPGKFFYEMAKVSGYSESTIRTTYYRAKKADLLSNDPVPRLTAKGQRKIQPYIAQKLGKNARLIVIFDISVERTRVRNAFRRLLKNLDFTMIQQSVWVTEYDHRLVLVEAVKEFHLENAVEIHESLRLWPKK